MAETQKTRTKQYEGMFLFGANASTDVNGAIATARGMIEKHGGEILVIKKWDERKLTYEMKKQKRGTYVIAYFKAPTSAITPIDREVRLSEEVLRVLITDAEHLNQAEMEAVEPQPIIKAEPPAWDRGFGGGGDRGDRGGDRGDRGDRGGDRGGERGDRGGDRGGERGGDRPPRPRREEQPAEAGAARE